MPYANATWSQLKTALRQRLSSSLSGTFEPSAFWSDDSTVQSEIEGYLKEALRVWAAASHFWKGRTAFNVDGTGFWHDLSPAAELAYTVTDRQLAVEMEYHFIEPPSYTTWLGSDQFNLSELRDALQRRRDQFLMETGAHVFLPSLVSGIAPPISRFEIPVNTAGEPIMDVRRLSWVSAAGLYAQLWRGSEWGANAVSPGWGLTPDTPAGFSVVASPPLTVQLIPPPNEPGRLEVVGVYAGAALDFSTGVLLGIPDNFSWVVKYGAMADLLGKDSQARDTFRAQYCERRWKEGIELARLYSTVMLATVNGQQTPCTPVQKLDAYQPGWQNTTPGPPTMIGLEGLNLICVNTLPDTMYGVSLDILLPAPIPADDAAFVQLGPEELDAVIDYAQHIASFKQSGSEFEATTRQYENLIKLAGVYNEKLRASTVFAGVIHNRSMQEEIARPRRSPAVTGNILEV